MSKRKKRSITLPAIGHNGGIDLHLVEVQDPYEPDKKLRVARNVRNHPLDEEFAAGSISQDQLAAGNKFLELYERAEIGGAQAIDYSAVKVDTSYVHKGLAVGVMESAQELKGIRAALGSRSYDLLVSIIGNRRRIDAMARDYQEREEWRTRQHRIYLRHAFAAALLDLCSHFDVVARGRDRCRILSVQMSQD
jgi:hypothetical protein